MNNKPISILSLPEITDPKDFWIPISAHKPELITGKYNLSKFLEELKETVQLERRIVCVFDGTAFEVPIPEKTHLYKVSTLRNVAKLEMSLDEQKTWQDVTIGSNGQIDVHIPADTIAWFKPTKDTIDARGYATFLGRADINLK